MKIIESEGKESFSDFLVMDDGSFACLKKKRKTCKMVNLTSGFEYPEFNINDMIGQIDEAAFRLKIHSEGFIVVASYYSLRKRKRFDKFFDPMTGKEIEKDLPDFHSVVSEVYFERPVLSASHAIFSSASIERFSTSYLVSPSSFMQAVKAFSEQKKKLIDKLVVILKRDGTDLRVMELPFCPENGLISGDGLTAMFMSASPTKTIVMIDLD